MHTTYYTQLHSIQDDDDDYQERYQTLMKIMVLVFGKKITRLIVLLSGLPFGLIYAIVSTFVRVLYVVVRVKPLDEDGDGKKCIMCVV